MMQTIQKIKVLTNQTAIKYMEDDLVRLEKEIEDLKQRHQDLEAKKSLDLDKMKARLKHVVEHLGLHFKNQAHPLKKAKLFGLLFDNKPTYEDLEGGTRKSSLLQVLNPVFSLISSKTYQMVSPRGTKTNTPEELFSALIELGSNPLLDFAEDSGNQLSFFCSCAFCEKGGYA